MQMWRIQKGKEKRPRVTQSVSNPLTADGGRGRKQFEGTDLSPMGAEGREIKPSATILLIIRLVPRAEPHRLWEGGVIGLRRLQEHWSLPRRVAILGLPESSPWAPGIRVAARPGIDLLCLTL
ncbi:hypothetical protein E2562_008879 [Oryza meyeriana var. granulata]|uniref:Uncharacterized protein n=1 Tax=Oryza meyeriana var. granulata TaxID=110450 RepID=A0A6G1D0Z9_9ORYZ|nr:hypothetical protein E2562_008879 [Oryza meyeriana var. granulata]